MTAPRPLGSRLALLALGGVVAGFALLEVGLRTYALVDAPFRTHLEQLTHPPSAVRLSSWTPHPFLPFVGQPNADYLTHLDSWGLTIRVQNNSYGFRTHEFPEHKQPGDYVVVCLGESTTWGAAAETNAATWPELLEQRLATQYPTRKVTVFNLGVPSGTTAYSLIVLALIGVHLQPDLVIVYHGYNEYGAMMANNFRTDQAHHFYDLDPGEPWHGVQSMLPRWLLSSAAVAVASSALDNALQVNSMAAQIVRTNEPVETYPNPGVQSTLQNLRSIAAIAIGQGAAVLFSTFQYYDGRDKISQRVNTSLRDFFAAQQLPYVDQDALIPDYDRSINLDACHFTRKGDELVAQNFFDAIVAGRLVAP